MQTLRAFMEAESYPGPSLIIAYSPCIAHGVDLKHNLRQQDLAVKSGHWPIFRYDPRRALKGENPLKLDSKEPSIPFADIARTEVRFSMLERSNPERSKTFLAQAEEQVRARYHHYKELSEISWENDGSLAELPKEDD